MDMEYISLHRYIRNTPSDTKVCAEHQLRVDRSTWQAEKYICCCVALVVSDSVRPHRWQPTRLPRPWDSPGKNTGVGHHFLLQCMKVKSESEVAQLCPTLATPWTAAYQAPLSMGFSRQKYWSGVPLPSLIYTINTLIKISLCISLLIYLE